MAERHVEKRLIPLGGYVSQGVTPCCGECVVRELGHLVAAHDLLDEGLLSGGQKLADSVRLKSTLRRPGVVDRKEKVYSVGPTHCLLLDPGQVDLELVWCVSHGTQHPKPTGVRDCCHDVAAVAEREDGKLHSKHFADPGVHVLVLLGPGVPRVSHGGRATSPTTPLSGIDGHRGDTDGRGMTSSSMTPHSARCYAVHAPRHRAQRLGAARGRRRRLPAGQHERVVGPRSALRRGGRRVREVLCHTSRAPDTSESGALLTSPGRPGPGLP